MNRGTCNTRLGAILASLALVLSGCATVQRSAEYLTNRQDCVGLEFEEYSLCLDTVRITVTYRW